MLAHILVGIMGVTVKFLHPKNIEILSKLKNYLRSWSHHRSLRVLITN